MVTAYAVPEIAAQIAAGRARPGGGAFLGIRLPGAFDPAALLLDREPALDPDQVKHRLLSSATPGPAGDPNVDGHGSLDTYAAAHAGTGTRANQGVGRSLGTGSIDADRGSLSVQIETQSLIGWLLQTVFKLLTGALTAQNQLFDSLEFTSTEWTGTSWYSSQWYGTSWYGTSWYGTSWYGTSWYGTSWYGTSWYGAAWE